MGDLATLPTFAASPSAYTHTDLNAIFQAITIAPGAVTFTKLQPIATDNLLGRSTSGSGNVELIPCKALGRALLALDPIATDKLLGRASGGSGNVELIDLTAAGRALLDDADAAAQRTTLGLLGSNLEHSVSGSIQAGTSGADLIYSTGPTLDLTAGTWLVLGMACMRTNDTIGEYCLGLRNMTDGTDFGKGAAMKNEGLAVIHPMSCFGFVTLTGTKTIRLKGFISGAHTLEMGTVNGISGVIRAIRLNT